MEKLDRIIQLETMLENSPNDLFLLYALGIEYKAKGDIGRAIEYFKSIFALNPEYLPIYYMWAEILVECGEVEEALDLYDKGLKIAQAQNNRKTESELRTAKLNLMMEL